MTNEKQDILYDLINDDGNEVTREGELVRRINSRIKANDYTAMRLLAHDRGISFSELLSEVVSEYVKKKENAVKELRFEKAKRSAVLNNPKVLEAVQKDPDILNDEKKFISALKKLKGLEIK